jgi:hypothetical protein
MDPILIVGIIGAASTIIAALIGRSDLMDKIIRGPNFPRITGRWESSWSETENDTEKTYKEIFHVTKQKGSRIYGYITMETEPDKRWDIYGDFNGRFLRLFWHPSRDADDKFFLDYGCYFFELQGNGSFTGYAVGFDWGTNKTEIGPHILRRVK